VVLFLLSSQIGASDDYNLTAVAIFAVAAAGLNLLTGLNGQLSLGHGALMAIGAYTASLLLKDHRQFPVIVVLLAAVLSTGVIGIGFGYAAARLRGPYLAGATLTLAVAIPQVATRYKRSEEHTSELQSLAYLVCRLLLEKKKKKNIHIHK